MHVADSEVRYMPCWVGQRTHIPVAESGTVDKEYMQYKEGPSPSFELSFERYNALVFIRVFTCRVEAGPEDISKSAW